MKFILAILALAVTTYGQQVTPAACLSPAAAIPTCALSCISAAASRAGCGQYDLACQCGPASAAINLNAEPCVLTACTPIESAVAVASSAAAVCACVATASTGVAAVTTAPASSSAVAASTSASTSVSTSVSTTSVASQESDGQPQAPSATSPVTGGSAQLAALGGFAGVVLGVAALL